MDKSAAASTSGAKGPPNTCPVNSHNEWDPLEEIIVGRLEGATMPTAHVSVTYNIPPTTARVYKWIGGRPYPKIMTKEAQKELDEFIHILEAEGITVRRPDIVDFSIPVKASASPAHGTGSWSSEMRSSRRRWRGARASSSRTPITLCSRSTLQRVRGGRPRRSRS